MSIYPQRTKVFIILIITEAHYYREIFVSFSVRCRYTQDTTRSLRTRRIIADSKHEVYAINISNFSVRYALRHDLKIIIIFYSAIQTNLQRKCNATQCSMPNPVNDRLVRSRLRQPVRRFYHSLHCTKQWWIFSRTGIFIIFTGT